MKGKQKSARAWQAPTLPMDPNGINDANKDTFITPRYPKATSALKKRLQKLRLLIFTKKGTQIQPNR